MSTIPKEVAPVQDSSASPATAASNNVTPIAAAAKIAKGGLPDGWKIRCGQPRPAYVTAQDANTEVANAQRIAHLLRDKLLYVNKVGWHVFAPPWRPDERAARELVQMLGRKIAQSEAAQMAKWAANGGSPEAIEKRRMVMDKRFKWAKQSESRKVIDNSLALATDLMSVEPEQMDANPNILGCRNGLLDLNSCAFRDYLPSDLVSRTTGCDYDPSARCETWVRFVSQVLAGDREAIDWFRMFLGSCLPGMHRDQLLLICVGGGGNGKSTLFEAIGKALGTYCDPSAPGLLISARGDRHPTEVADLKGRRLVISAETGESNSLAEDKVKTLTGNDVLKARLMKKDFFSFVPTHQIVMFTNHKPKIRGTDQGIWRRIRLMMFRQHFTGNNRDKKMPEKLEKELSGILNWLVAGLREYRINGLDDLPKSMREANAEYRKTQDIIGSFIDQCHELGVDGSTSSGRLYEVYRTWAKTNGEMPRSAARLKEALIEHDLEFVRDRNGSAWRAVGVRTGAGLPALDGWQS